MESRLVRARFGTATALVPTVVMYTDGTETTGRPSPVCSTTDRDAGPVPAAHPYLVVMHYVVVTGPFQGPPDSIVGPFDTLDDAHEYAQAQAGDPEHRFAAVMPLLAPDQD
jgi:hypothetical protein